MVHTTENRDLTPWIGAGIVLAAIAVILANSNVSENENGGTGEMIGTLIFVGILAAAVYLLLPRVGRPATVGIAIGIIAVLAVAVYWSGLPFLLGAIAFALGRRASSEGTRPMVAQVLGAVAVVAGVVALIADKA